MAMPVVVAALEVVVTVQAGVLVVVVVVAVTAVVRWGGERRMCGLFLPRNCELKMSSYFGISRVMTLYVVGAASRGLTLSAVITRCW